MKNNWRSIKMNQRMLNFIFVLVVVILFLPNVVFASGWLKNKDGIMVWSTSDSLDGESFKWKGAAVDKYAEGLGTLELYNNGKLVASYKGSMHLGKYHGKGIYVWSSDGDRYEGDFVEGIKTGKGTYFFANGKRYEGDFIDDKRTGKGTFMWPNGDRYEGDFIDGNRTGKGTYVWPNGDRYEGDFVEGVITGKGAYIYSNGEKYVGEWKENKKHGKGVLYNANGSINKQGNWVSGEYVQSIFEDTEYVFKNLLKNPQVFAEKHLMYGKRTPEFDLWVGGYGNYIREIHLGLENGVIKYAFIKVDDFGAYNIARPIVVDYYGKPSSEGGTAWGTYKSEWLLNDVSITLSAAVTRGSSFYGETSEKSFMMFTIRSR